jgi:2-polyprenyl-6-methoxyphenol hydroxylase-like FAD-dependent oxidoreductase
MANRFRIAVVGGSVAGCAAAVELSRADHEVKVFERSATALVSQEQVLSRQPRYSRAWWRGISCPRTIHAAQ